MDHVFRVPMSRRIILAFYTFLTLTAGATVWSFGSGFLWTGICLIAVAGPLTILYWYMLTVNPARARIAVGPEGLLVTAEPFFEAALPWGAISGTYRASLADSDTIQLGKSVKSMHFGAYRSGEFEGPGDQKIYVLTNRDDVLCVQSGDKLFVLGPTDIDGLEAALGEAS